MRSRRRKRNWRSVIYDEPVAVWTGSTNRTENGIFGHSNCVNVIEDAGVSAAYLNYWHNLKNDPTTTEGKK
jgi:hypothetical protein